MIESMIQNMVEECVQREVQKLQPVEPKPAPIIVKGERICQEFDITIQTVIRWRKKGKIPFLQIGSAIRYDLNKVVEALEVSNKKKSC